MLCNLSFQYPTTSASFCLTQLWTKSLMHVNELNTCYSGCEIDDYANYIKFEYHTFIINNYLCQERVTSHVLMYFKIFHTLFNFIRHCWTLFIITICAMAHNYNPVRQHLLAYPSNNSSTVESN